MKDVDGKQNASFGKEGGKHPTQKPEYLMENIVLSSTKRGDLVLDPFCGSGTTGVAAVRFGRRFIGIDNEKEYIETAFKRMSNVQEELEW